MIVRPFLFMRYHLLGIWIILHDGMKWCCYWRGNGLIIVNVMTWYFAYLATLKVDYLIICIICDTDSVNKLTLQMYTLHKYKQFII